MIRSIAAAPQCVGSRLRCGCSGTPAKLYISVRRKVYWNIQVSPRCHSLSIFVYVIFTMSKIVLRNVCVCLNVYLCPRLSAIVCNCLWMSQDIVYCLFAVCNNLAISTFELFSFSISLHQHDNCTPTTMSITTTHCPNSLPPLDAVTTCLTVTTCLQRTTVRWWMVCQWCIPTTTTTTIKTTKVRLFDWKDGGWS